MSGKMQGLREQEDPVFGEFLRFLARDMRQHPERLRGFDPEFVKRVQKLAGIADIDLDCPLSPLVD